MTDRAEPSPSSHMAQTALPTTVAQAPRTRRGSSYRSPNAPVPSPNVLAGDAPLTRADSSNSAHAGTSLRRMATHETGEDFDELHETRGTRGLDTHEEHEHELEHHDEEGNRTSLRQGPIDEEAVIGTDRGAPKKQKFELQDQTNLLPYKQVAVIFMGLNCALFVSLLDQTIVTTALPTLGKVFNQASIASWVGTAYMLTSTALQPVYGRLSDIFGRKAVLLASLAIFFFGSLACALAQTMIQLIIFRAIQGMGGGGILTLSMIIISDVVSLKDRGKFQGITGGVVAIANSVGPILGGIFTEKVTWRWCFYINLPLTALAVVVIIFLLPLKAVKGSWIAKLKKVDFYGSILTLAWAVLVLIALSWSGTTYSWSSAAVIAPLVIGICLLFVFIYVEMKVVPLPLVPMYIFRNMTVAASMATTFCNGAAFYATLYYLPQYFQVVRGESPIQSGVDVLPLCFIQVFCSFLSGFLVSKTGDYKWNLMAGFFIWTIGLGMMTTMHPTTPKPHIYGFQALLGIGAGQTFQTSLIAIQAAVERKDMATATGCRNFLRMLGGTVALAACAAIVNNLASTRLAKLGFGEELVDAILSDPTQLADLGLDAAHISAVREIYAQGISACFYFCIPMAGISLFITIFFIKRIPLRRDDDAKLKAEAKAWVEEKKRGHGAVPPSVHSVHSDAPGAGKGTSAGSASGSSAATLSGQEVKLSQAEHAPAKIESRLSEDRADVQKAVKGFEEAAGVMTEPRRD